MKITMVKKILADGSPCKKCGEVMEKIEESDQLRFIDRIIVADENDPESEGIQVAMKYNVNRAPFFVVEQDNGEVEIYTVYFKLVKEVLSGLADA